MLSVKFDRNWSRDWREDVFNVQFCKCISLFSPLGKEPGPSFEQTWISKAQGCFVFETAPVALEKMILMRKSLQTNGRQTIRKSQLSFRVRQAKREINIITTSCSYMFPIIVNDHMNCQNCQNSNRNKDLIFTANYNHVSERNPFNLPRTITRRLNSPWTRFPCSGSNNSVHIHHVIKSNHND